MAKTLLVPIDRPEVPPRPIGDRLRGQLVYFRAAPEPGDAPEVVRFDPQQVAHWLDEGTFALVSPLDTANMTDCELTEEQETLLEWLQREGVAQVRVATGP